MFSKISLFLAVLIFATSCSLKVGDKNRKQEKLRLKNSFSCMREIADNVDTYLSGSMPTKKVEVFMSCVHNALSKFEEYTRGQNVEIYKPGEIRNFLESHFMGKGAVSDELLEEVMSLKRVLVGGTKIDITRKEWKRLLFVINFIKKTAVRLNPYIDIYNLDAAKERRDVDLKELEKARRELDNTAEEIADLMATTGVSYSFASLSNLITHMRKFVKWDEKNETRFTPEQLQSLTEVFKLNMLGPQRDLVRSEEWTPLLKSMVGWYNVYLDYRYHIQDGVISFGPGLESFQKTIGRVFDLLENGLKAQPETYISYNQLYEMAEVFEDAQLIPLQVKASTLKKALPVFFNRVMRAEDDPARGLGLTLGNLNEMRSEFENWSAPQTYMSQLLRVKSGQRYNWNTHDVNTLPVFPKLLSFDFKNYIDQRNYGGSADPRFESMNRIIKEVRPHFRDNQNKMVFIYKEEFEDNNLKYAITDLTHKNIFRSIIRLLMRGFSKGDSATEFNGVDIQDMKDFYKRVRLLGRDLKFMDPRSCDVGARVFKEANLFTFVGNGLSEDSGKDDHLMSFNEGVEYLAFLYSSGNTRELMFNDTERHCKSKVGPDVDPFGQKEYSRECFLTHFKRGLPHYISNMPYMKKYIEKIKTENEGLEYELFIDRLQSIAYIDGENREWLELGEMETMALILHYVESTFIQFDKNKDFKLDTKELWVTYERFKGFIRMVGKEKVGKPPSDLEEPIESGEEEGFWKNTKDFWSGVYKGAKDLPGKTKRGIVGDFDEDWTKALFKFLVKKKRMPTGMDELAKVYFDQLTDPDWGKYTTMEIDRSDFVEILSQLKLVKKKNAQQRLLDERLEDVSTCQE